MARSKPNTQLNRGRPLAIMLLLVVALALIGVLGWQSWKLQQSHLETADSVLREYAILAADEFGRRATAQLGYQGFYTLISRSVSLASPSLMRAELIGNDALAGLVDLPATFFVIGREKFEIDGAALSSDVKTLLQNTAIAVNETEEPYYSRRTEDNSEQVILGFRRTEPGEPEVVGFVVNNSGIGTQLQQAFNNGPLLPVSLAGGQVSNKMLFARVTDPSGVVLFEENPVFNSYLTVSRTLGDEYQGILENFRIEVSLDPYSADTLVIGGLPRSRLPLLLLAMLLVAGLMLTAIWLFRREAAVMKLRSDFVSQVSHELRTPLTQIRMFAETLLMDRARNDAERQRSLEIINRESQRLSHLVENILRFSNGSEPLRLDCREQALAPIVREVCSIVQNTNDSVTITTNCDDSVTAVADADAVRQIVLNLLDNAVKYGPAEHEILVSLIDTGARARLSIEDQGPGIPASERDLVFSPFYRMRREEIAAISGTGIGLSVVRELVEAMGGTCIIKGGETGAKVCVELPTRVTDD